MSDGINQFESFQSDIIGRPPNNITRYGISFIFAFMLLVLFFAYKIDYSDSIVSRIVINSQTPTVYVGSEYAGVIEQVFVANTEQVNAGDNIVLLKNNTDLDTVAKLKVFLISGDLFSDQIGSFNNTALGSLRSDFYLLIESLNKYTQAKNTVSVALRQEQLIDDNLSLYKQIKELKVQHDLYRQRNALFDKRYQRSLDLAQQKLLSQSELDQAQSNFLDSKISANQVQVEISRIESLISNNKKQMNLLSIDNDELKSELLLKIESQKQVLIDKVNNWEKRHLIKAPISGKLSLPNNIFVHQSIDYKQELFSIIPTSNNLLGKIKIPELGAGKIIIGQRVQIQLDSFPYQEFGEISGKVINKSTSVHDASIYIEIQINDFNPLTNELTSTYAKKIKYLPNMQGQVEIITNKKNILTRIFENLIVNF